MKQIFLIVWVVLSISALAQKPQEINSELKEVTVFLKGAQLTRVAKTDIPAGTSTVKLVGMSPFLDRKTLLVKGLGDFTILSVNHQLNYLNEKKLEEKFITLNDTIAFLTRTLEDIQNELATLMEKESFLKFVQNFLSSRLISSILQFFRFLK